MNKVTSFSVKERIAKGLLRNDKYATNFSMAFFQNPNAYASKSIFPTVRVAEDVGKYFIFNKEDLARINVARKPQLGKVQPFMVSNDEELYSVEVYQAIIGLDRIQQTRVERGGTVGASDIKKSRAKILAEQFGMFQDVMFADNFFKAGVWNNEYTGVDASATGKQFLKFANANFEPIKFFDELKTEMLETTRREPNKLLLGRKAYNALRENPDLRERISGNSSKAMPAILNHADLCKLLEIEQIAVFGSSYNAAPVGKPADMKFIADPNSALLCYAPNSPAIDEPSAGYSFTWDMLGNGDYAPMFVHEGEWGTHSEFMEGLIATSHKKTCDELGVFLKDCV